MLGNLKEAARHLETSFQMDKKFREIASWTRFESNSRPVGQMIAEPGSRSRSRHFQSNFVRGVEWVHPWLFGRTAPKRSAFTSGWMDGEANAMDRETMVLVWSATKGLASACLLHALEGAGV